MLKYKSGSDVFAESQTAEAACSTTFPVLINATTGQDREQARKSALSGSKSGQGRT